jgi:hypothetical protein
MEPTPTQSPRKDHHFRVHGVLGMRTIANLIFATRKIRQGEALWVELGDALQIDADALLALASWVLTIRGHKVFVSGLHVVGGESDSAPRPAAFA